MSPAWHQIWIKIKKNRVHENAFGHFVRTPISYCYEPSEVVLIGHLDFSDGGGVWGWGVWVGGWITIRISVISVNWILTIVVLNLSTIKGIIAIIDEILIFFIPFDGTDKLFYQFISVGCPFIASVLLFFPFSYSFFSISEKNSIGADVPTLVWVYFRLAISDLALKCFLFSSLNLLSCIDDIPGGPSISFTFDTPDPSTKRRIYVVPLPNEFLHFIKVMKGLSLPPCLVPVLWKFGMTWEEVVPLILALCCWHCVAIILKFLRH